VGERSIAVSTQPQSQPQNGLVSPVTDAEITYYWDPDEPERIHLWIKNSRFTDANGEHIGIWNVYSANPKSADYSPSNFNRVARALRVEGRPAPEHDAPEHDRRLRSRPKLIKAYEAAQES
jgi:hypothetical protein